MKLATTTEDFEPYCHSFTESIEHVYNAGFKCVDLSLEAIAYYDEQLMGDDWKKGAAKIKAFADSLGVEFVQAHAASGNIYYPGYNKEEIISKVIRSIEVCGEIGIKNVVVHSHTKRGLTKDEYIEKNREFIRHYLFPVMEKTGVNVLCENSPTSNLVETYYTDEKIEHPKLIPGHITGEDMRKFVEYVNHPLYHACWDTGHANIEGPQYKEIMAIGDELYGLHVNDNRGKEDEHLIPYCGTLNLDDLMHGLIDSGYKGSFTFEGCSMLHHEGYWLGVRHEFEKDKRLVNPTLKMQECIEKFMYEVGVNTLKAYNCFEG